MREGAAQTDLLRACARAPCLCDKCVRACVASHRRCIVAANSLDGRAGNRNNIMACAMTVIMSGMKASSRRAHKRARKQYRGDASVWVARAHERQSRCLSSASPNERREFIAKLACLIRHTASEFELSSTCANTGSVWHPATTPKKSSSTRLGSARARTHTHKMDRGRAGRPPTVLTLTRRLCVRLQVVLLRRSFGCVLAQNVSAWKTNRPPTRSLCCRSKQPFRLRAFSAQRRPFDFIKRVLCAVHSRSLTVAQLRACVPRCARLHAAHMNAKMENKAPGWK